MARRFQTVTDVGRVLPRGQITLPKAVRHEANIQPGQPIAFQVLGDGRVEIRVLSRLSLDEALSRFSVDAPYDDEAVRAAWQVKASEDVIRD